MNQPVFINTLRHSPFPPEVVRSLAGTVYALLVAESIDSLKSMIAASAATSPLCVAVILLLALLASRQSSSHSNILNCNANGLFTKDSGNCSCFQCWTGAACERRIEKCLYDATIGETTMYEDYWLMHPELDAEIPMAFHISYTFDYTYGMLPRLERAIRQLHMLTGNAVTEGRYLVPGIGSFELINAVAAAAVAHETDGANTGVWCADPCWFGYFLLEHHSATRVLHGIDGMRETPHIEIVTNPNNPDGALQHKSTNAPLTLYDHAYYWPQFVGVSPVAYGDDGVATFTMSKSFGLSSSRVGWALTSNKTLADSILRWMRSNRFTMPLDGQIRSAVAIEHLLSTNGTLFRWARQLMWNRWVRLRTAFARSRVWRLVERGRVVDHFSGTGAYEDSPAYAWCERVDGSDAFKAFKEIQIITTPGPAFSAPARFARLALMMRERDFQTLFELLLKGLGELQA